MSGVGRVGLLGFWKDERRFKRAKGKGSQNPTTTLCPSAPSPLRPFNMKLFWTIIIIFALAAAGIVWAQTRVEPSPQFAAQPPQGTSAPPIRDPLIAEVSVAPTTDPGAEAVPDDAPLQAALDNAAEPGEDTMGEQPADPQPADQATAPSEDGDAAQQLIDDLLGGRPTAPPIGTTNTLGPEHEGHLAGKPNPDLPPRVENPWQAEAPDKQPIKHSIEQQPDGSALVDGLFTIKGKGTAEAPYEITWDLLMSAAETYQPRLGMEEIPERINMLDGAYVKVSGFIMFPMTSYEAKEALVMLNMWDGCCIGTMPSPYDAIEVQFTQGIPASTRQFANYGTVEGRLVVDPYLISDWLIGLYVLEDATLHLGM